MTRQFCLPVITALFLLLSAFPSYAQQWYHVEVIVFEQLNTVTDEQWPVMSSIPNAPLTPRTDNAIIQPTAHQELATSAKRLANSSRYRLHYHDSWQQPILTKGRAQAVEIINPDRSIEGSIRLYKGTYLYSTVDIWLNKNLPTNPSWSDTEPMHFDSETRNPHLLESRRVRSSKLHYFDHPKIGFLLQLTPIDTPNKVAQQQVLETYSLPSEGQAVTAE
jgi:hypothetical protein